MWRTLVCLMISGVASAQSLVPNGSFEQGTDKCDQWVMPPGGQWAPAGPAPDAGKCISITGDGKEVPTAWTSAPLSLQVGHVYGLAFRARSISASGGTAISGPSFCNRDLGTPSSEWTPYNSFFIVPENMTPAQSPLLFGLWGMKGTVAFDDVVLKEAIPFYARSGDIELGAGEQIDANHYTCVAPGSDKTANQSRCLESQTTTFNTTRWVFGADQQITFRHSISTHRQSQPSVSVAVNHYASGSLTVETSSDGKRWTTLGTLNSLSTQKWPIPAPAGAGAAPAVWVRLRATADANGACYLQVNHYEYTADLDRTLPNMIGSTLFALVSGGEPAIKISNLGIGDGIPGSDNRLTGRLTGLPATAKTADLKVLGPGGTSTSASANLQSSAGASSFDIPYRVEAPGDYTLQLTIPASKPLQLEIPLYVGQLHRADYGELLNDGPVQLWWCSSAWKVSNRRSAPTTKGAAVVIRAAAGEPEAAQLVVRPKQLLRNLTMTCSDLTGAGGARIPASAVDLLRVEYVTITQTSDPSAVTGSWPDPLPPMDRPVQVNAGTNQPLWVRVNVPRTAAAGKYRGQLQVRADGLTTEIPLELQVYAFALPETMTCQTAFGFEPSTIWQYHRLADPKARREVLGKYLAELAAHHISPYDPAPLDPIVVTWPADMWTGGDIDKTEKHSGNASRRIVDDKPNATVNVAYQKSIPIPSNDRLRLSGWCRTERPGQIAMVSIGHHDQTDQWMSGRNVDFAIEGTGQWQRFEYTLPASPPGAKGLRINLWPTKWTEAGELTGTAWFDDLSLTRVSNNAELLVGGGFEPPSPDDLAPRMDFTAWDKAMQQAIDVYHFNTFVVSLPGMGGGTFASRTEPSLLGYPASSPEYQAAFSSYARQLQDHLQSKGWLDRAFVYWFDEPDTKDYPFVMEGFARLKKYAPGIRRMLTEQVEPALIGGPNLWCPVTSSYEPGPSQQQQAVGDQFWWYVCTAPKAPYATEFIDHGGTEMRVWAWQTWQRKINGLLIWATNYWTSNAAYPDPKHPQNPYLDAVAWMSGYDTKAGVRIAWGNGDGRFLYPPHAVFDTTAGPVMAGPVGTIRLEMLRDGIEDYEYLAIFSRLLKEKGDKLDPATKQKLTALLEVPDTITTTLTSFTTRPEPIETRRDEVAKAIEQLTAR